MLATDTPAELLRRLQLTVARRLDGLLHGDYQGLVPGHGSEPGETREYAPGDDVRRIDWNVTARTQVVQVRETVADRELELTLVLDLSPSLHFGTARSTKRDLAVAAATAVSLLAARAGNRIGALVTTGAGVVKLPPRPGRDALLGLLHRVATTEAVDGSGPTDLATALVMAAKAARRRGMVVVVSDFLTPAGWERPLRALAHRHDVLVFEVVDPRELELPDVGVLEMVDPETGRRRLIDTASASLRERYAAAAAEQRRAIAATVRRTGASHLVLRTDRDWLVELARFVAERRRMAAGTNGSARTIGIGASS